MPLTRAQYRREHRPTREFPFPRGRDSANLYSAPSLAAFTSQAGATNVISGTVTASRPLVTEPANTVETILTISVDRQRDTSAPIVVEVREQGGVFSVAQVRSDFEG